MRLSISLSLATLFLGIASAAACTPGQYACGSGDVADTVMQCGVDGIPVPINKCGGGLTCKTISGRVLCA